MDAVFFYGLFMDAQLLQRRGVRVAAQSRARLEGYKLVLGSRATLVRAPGFTAHGMLMELPAEDVERLYSEPSVAAYRPEPVRVVLENGQTSAARCYNLPGPLSTNQPDAEYARQLYELGLRLGLPDGYLSAIAAAAADKRPV